LPDGTAEQVTASVVAWQSSRRSHDAKYAGKIRGIPAGAATLRVFPFRSWQEVPTGTGSGTTSRRCL